MYHFIKNQYCIFDLLIQPTAATEFLINCHDHYYYIQFTVKPTEIV